MMATVFERKLTKKYLWFLFLECVGWPKYIVFNNGKTLRKLWVIYYFKLKWHKYHSKKKTKSIVLFLM